MFSPILWIVFWLFSVVCIKAETYVILIKPNSFFVIYALRRLCLTQSHEIYFYSFCWEFYTFGFYICVCDPFWVNFLCMIQKRNPPLLLCMWISWWPSTICWKDNSSASGVGTLYVKQFDIRVRVYRLFSFPSTDQYVYVYANITLSWLLWFCSNFEIRKCKSSNFVLFENGFGYLASLHFHMNFRISLPLIALNM